MSWDQNSRRLWRTKQTRKTTAKKNKNKNKKEKGSQLLQQARSDEPRREAKERALRPNYFSHVEPCKSQSQGSRPNQR